MEKIYIVGASYSGANMYRIKFSDGKVIQFNCHEDDLDKNDNPLPNTLVSWLQQFGGELELDVEPAVDYKVSDERNAG